MVVCMFSVLLFLGTGLAFVFRFGPSHIFFDLLLLGCWIVSSSFCSLCLAYIDGISVYSAEFLV